MIPRPPFASALTLEQELAEFEALKPRLAEVWDSISGRDEEPHTSVVVPSLTLDQAEMKKLEGASFYEERLQDVYDARTLQKMVRDRGSDSFLRMTEEDVLRQAPDPAELSLFPDSVPAGRLALPLSYRFSPGEADDGVTLKLPASVLTRLRPEAVEWAIPGLMQERVTALVKALRDRGLS